jgi:hypothetical protein
VIDWQSANLGGMVFTNTRATLPMRYGRREVVVDIVGCVADVTAVECSSCGAFVRARAACVNVLRLAPRCEDCEREIGGES